MYVRFEAADANARGVRHGVFGLANGLAHAGRLSDEDHAWWRRSNDWMNDAYADPGSVDRTLFDRTVNPIVECWFKESATHLVARTREYLDLLDRYGVAWVERRSDAPGTILYEDDVQVVVAP